MVISFSVKEARDQLMNEGEVYTFRWPKRKQLGKTWANVKRGTKKMCDVHIEEVGSITNLFQLKDYVEKSGFSHIGAWATVIMNMHKPGSEMIGWMYKVSNCGSCGWYHSAKRRCCYHPGKCTWTSQDSQQVRKEP